MAPGGVTADGPAGAGAAASTERSARPRGGRALRRAGRWIAERRIVLATGMAASVPVVASLVHALDVRWTPVADAAIIAVRALDTLTTDSSLLGQWSSGATAAGSDQTYGLGPLLFWLFALPVRLPDPVWMAVTSALVNVASIMGAVALARRRGGPGLMVATAVAIPIMCASFPAAALSDVWNPSLPLLPFTLLVYLAWSLACGEFRLLPVTVLVASFAAQSHLTYVPPVGGVVSVGLAGLLLARRRAARAGAPAPGERRAWRRWLLAAATVAVVCWSAPLVEQAIHRPGNMVLLARAASTDEATLGGETGARAVVRAIGVPPWWLEGFQSPLERIGDLSADAGVGSVVSALLVLAGLAAVAALGLRRRRPDMVAAGALGLVLCGALAVAAASIPRDSFHTAGYALWWASPVGMFAWLVLGWAAASLLPRLTARPAVASRGTTALAGVVLVATVAGVVAAQAERRDEYFAEMRLVAERLDGAVPPDGLVQVEAASSPSATFTALDFQAGIVYELRRRGRDVAAPNLAVALGGRYETDGARPSHVLRVDADRPPPADARVLVRRTVRRETGGDPFQSDRPEVVTVSLQSAP